MEDLTLTLGRLPQTPPGDQSPDPFFASRLWIVSFRKWYARKKDCQKTKNGIQWKHQTARVCRRAFCFKIEAS